MKRLQILTKPTKIAELADIDTDTYDDTWLLKAEKFEAKRMRRLKQQLAG